MDIKTERFLRELDQRTKLWERIKLNAEVRMKVEGVNTVLAKKDIEVAESALKRIEAKKKEVVEEGEEPEVDEDVQVVTKKRVHKRPKAVFALAPVEDVKENKKHDV